MSNGPLHGHYSLIAFCTISLVFSDPVTYTDIEKFNEAICTITIETVLLTLLGIYSYYAQTVQITQHYFSHNFLMYLKGTIVLRVLFFATGGKNAKLSTCPIKLC